MNAYSCQNKVFSFRKVWRLRKQDQDVFFCFFLPTPQKKLDTPNIHKSPWKILHFDGINPGKPTSDFPWCFAFFRVLGSQSHVCFSWVAKKEPPPKWDTGRTWGTQGVLEDQWVRQPCGLWRASKWLSDDLPFLPEMVQRKIACIYKKVVVSFQIFPSCCLNPQVWEKE